MDNNNPIVQPATSQQPIQQAPVATASAGDSKKMIFWFVGGFVLIIALAVGVYLFMSKQQAAPQEQAEGITQTSMPVVEESLEDNLDRVSLDAAIDSDFSSVDQDLQSL